jgi:hypothetical protein
MCLSALLGRSCAFTRPSSPKTRDPRSTGTLTLPFDDFFFLPPADLGSDQTREYEETIVRLLMETLTPSDGPVIFVESVDLRGTRPDTEVIIRYRDTRKPGVHAVRSLPWKEFIEETDGKLDSAPDIASAILSRWSDDTLEAVPPDEIDR